jgi:hypothetical protein
MKHIKRIKHLALGTLLLPVAVLASGCATSRSTNQALVCPQCKDVAIERLPRAYSLDEATSYSFWEREETTIEHSCPGCQGALITLFKEGKLRHKCSICEQTPFSCPVSHR